jgi:hypothetical protein
MSGVMRKRSPFAVLVLALSLGAVAGCSEEPIPEEGFVDYVIHIQPMLNARCLRCHGAGGTLNGDPDVPDSGTFGTLGTQYMGKPTNGYFDCYFDRGDCTVPTNPGCRHGLRYYAGDSPGAALAIAWLPAMPPPPAQPLTSREKELLRRWLARPSAPPGPPYACD